MRYGLIGCGRIAINHIISCRSNNLDLVAICDTDPGKIDDLLSRCGIDGTGVKRYTDYRRMIGENSLDLAAVATDSGAHAEIVLSCIRRGINVIVEKPIAMSMADADAIISESGKRHVKVAVCHQNRFNQASQRMRAAREEGRFGIISHASVGIRWSRNKAYYDQAAWRGRWESDGGALMNQCIHGIDLLLWMMDSPVKTVYGVTRRRLHDYIEGEDVGLAVLSFENGAVATVEGTVNVYPSNLEETLCLFGEKGTAKLGGIATNSVDIWRFSNETDGDKLAAATAETVNNVYGNSHARLYADVIDAIRNDRCPCSDAVAGRNALEIVLAIYKSQKEGVPISLPLRNFASADMAGTFDA